MPEPPELPHGSVLTGRPVTDGMASEAKGSVKGVVEVQGGANRPPLTVPETPMLAAVHVEFGPAEMSPFTMMAPGETLKSALPASMSPRKHRPQLRSGVPVIPAPARASTSMERTPASVPRPKASRRLGTTTRTWVGRVPLSKEMQLVVASGRWASAAVSLHPDQAPDWTPKLTAAYPLAAATASRKHGGLPPTGVAQVLVVG